MTDTRTTPEAPEPAHSAFRVLAALADLGAANAATIAERAGLGYSTVTPKLRAWEASGHAEKYRQAHTNLVLWRLTAAGRAATATTKPHPAPGIPAAQTDDQPEPDAPTEPAPDPTAVTAADEPDSVRSAPPANDPTGQAKPAAQPASDHDRPSARSAPDTGSPPQVDPAVPSTAETQRNGEQGIPAATLDATGDGAPSKDTTTPVRRARGSLTAAILAICEANPGRQYKVGELSRLIDANNAGTAAKRASQGAVSNACAKLATAELLMQTVDKPATFQLASPAADRRHPAGDPQADVAVDPSPSPASGVPSSTPDGATMPATNSAPTVDGEAGR